MRASAKTVQRVLERDERSFAASPAPPGTDVSEAFRDGVAVLKVCDAVLGTITIGMALFATYASATGTAAVTTALLMWFQPIFNVAWSRVVRRSTRMATLEILRALVAAPSICLLYLTRAGPFAHFWPMAEVMVVGQCVWWGCVTGGARAGWIVAVGFGGLIFCAGSWQAGSVAWDSLQQGLVVGLTGIVLSVVAGHLGKALREARLRRDEAIAHKLELETAFKKLASTREQLDAVLQCAPSVIVAVNRDGRIEFANRAAPLLNAGDVLGTNLIDHLPPRARSLFEARLKGVLETGVSGTVESNWTTEDRSTHWCVSHLGAMHSGTEIVGAVLVFQDVTELKRTQAEVLAAQRMAAVGTLASGIAHEINTPMQFVNDNTCFLRDVTLELFNVIGKLQAVRRLAEAGTLTPELKSALADVDAAEEKAELPYLSENVPTAFESCIEGLERVTTIVRSMKEFAHPAEKEMAAVDLNQAIQNTLTIARNEYKYVAVVETDFADLPAITCFGGDVNQAVLNLIVNAAHAIGDVMKETCQKGTIGVKTRLDGSDVVVSISDTGTGIPESARSHIFELFFTTKEVGKGTGQGLALVWSIVKQKHGGDVTFETTVGKGTTFHLRLPVAGKPQAQSTDVSVSPRAA